MIETVRWAEQQFHQCLLDSPLAEQARRYLGERHFTGETIRRFGLGYAPDSFEWLTLRAASAGLSDELLETAGLIAKRREGTGYYDRFRDRVIFPIRNATGQTVAFGGRVLPGKDQDGPKYYNSAETPLFTKSEHLYGLDAAKQAGAKAGYLAVVEGYTDVLMAHQSGISQVVATLGTALNERHVRNLRRFVTRVVLVFDADAGGTTGIDRALEIFVSQNMDLAIATLPEGLDPFDLLVQQGPEPFQQALDNAVDALEYKVSRVLGTVGDVAGSSIEQRRHAIEEVLRIIALAPEMAGREGEVKRQLIVTRLSRRFHLREETIWERLRELRNAERVRQERRHPEERAPEQRSAPAPHHEKELLQVLLADPDLVRSAAEEVSVEEVQHPGLRRLLSGLYELLAEGVAPDLDHLRVRVEGPELIDHALKMQDVGQRNKNRPAWLREILAEFHNRRQKSQTRELYHQLHAARDHTEAVELFRRLQSQS